MALPKFLPKTPSKTAVKKPTAKAKPPMYKAIGDQMMRGC